MRNPKLFTGGTLTLELYNKIMDARNPISGYTLRDIIPKVHLHPVYKDQGRTENPLKLENSMLFKVPPKADEQQALEEKLAQYANITLDMLRPAWPATRASPRSVPGPHKELGQQSSRGRAKARARPVRQPAQTLPLVRRCRRSLQLAASACCIQPWIEGNPRLQGAADSVACSDS